MAPVFDSLTQTSEKTIEINILSECTKALLPDYFVTVLGPTLRQERELAFDDILAGLPRGRVIAFQFKKPILRSDGYPRFTLNVTQLQTLLGRFNRGEAFFVLCPFAETTGFVRAHRSRDLLRQTSSVDIYDITYAAKVTQRTRTIRYIDSEQLQVTDPLEYVGIGRARSLEKLTAAIKTENVGRLHMGQDRTERDEKEQREQKEQKKRYAGRTYYVHVTRVE